ncbi:AraC family transcriptional regulator [Pseudomonas oryzihabitans]|uniref:AraC family transcriptional regulator n=1 Tax=Pseudomonas oryzihabitans TaxID=47885 RepID=UPI0028938D07|nr:AraC family transcriptional regulator [Pseudomonas oryzihabitans]MDT3719084.1 AraC family transcriptional regulator [Pseudomonas oryzihabitans]
MNAEGVAMLQLSFTSPLRVQNGGHFISRGVGRHPRRILDSYELIYVDRGVLGLREEEAEFVLAAGEALLLQPGRLHEGLGDFDPELSFYWLHFELAAEPLSGNGLTVPQRSQVQAPERFVALLRLFLAEQEDGAPAAALELLLLALLERLARSPLASAAQGAGVALAYRARQLIRTRFGEALGAATLASALRCNPDYLGRVFRQTFGITLTEAIHRQRITAAERLLLNAELPLAGIAERCGFGDSAYFRRLFRRQRGMTPAAYRRLYCKEHINSA